MDNLRPTIRSIAEANAMHAKLLAGASRTAAWLRGFEGPPMALLMALRFETVGPNPLTGDPFTVIDQANQTFTILMNLRVIEQLLALHPEARGFRFALGASSERDVESVVPDLVAAAVFSARDPFKHQKLAKVLSRLKDDPACYRYVFFAAPGFAAGRHPRLEMASPIQVYVVEPQGSSFQSLQTGRKGPA